MLLTACGSDHLEGPRDSELPIREGLAGLLPVIPMPSGGGHWHSVYLNDYKGMREAHGIQTPEKDDTGAGLEEYLSRVFQETGAVGPWLSGYAPVVGLIDK